MKKAAFFIVLIVISTIAFAQNSAEQALFGASGEGVSVYRGFVNNEKLGIGFGYYVLGNGKYDEYDSEFKGTYMEQFLSGTSTTLSFKWYVYNGQLWLKMIEIVGKDADGNEIARQSLGEKLVSSDYSLLTQGEETVLTLDGKEYTLQIMD